MTDEQELPVRKPCPVCGRPSDPAQPPFCSQRCADVDLNRWLGGVYSVPGSSDPADEAFDEEP